MSIETDKKPWSISLVWSYFLGVIATFFLLPILQHLFFMLLNKPNSLEGMFKIEDLAILSIIFIPVIFVVKRNRSLLKAILFGFVIYAGMGVLFFLVGLTGSWGGRVTFAIFPYIAGIGFIGAFCTLMIFLFDKLLSRNKALS